MPSSSAPIRLGPHPLSGRFALSPLAEFTSWPLRLLCREFGAAFACTEMVKARFVAARHPETLKILERHPAEGLVGGQLCGAVEEELSAAAALLVHELGFPFVDFNLACPIRRIVAEGAGGGLLADPARVERLVRVLVQAAAPAPVTVKLRSGLDEDRITAVAVARAAEAGGAALIAVHPRTVKQGYGGRADHRVVAAVKAAVRVPVAGGGDMTSAAAALDLLRETGCDVVCFGRAATGDPWLFARARSLLESGTEPPKPARAELCRVFLRHAELLAEHLGERAGCLHVRKAAREYARALPGPAAQADFRARFSRVSTLDEVRTALGACSRGQNSRGEG